MSDDGRIFNPTECDVCTGGGCVLCHGDGAFCGSCRVPVSACVCGACEGWLEGVRVNVCQTAATTPEGKAAILGVVAAVAKRMGPGTPGSRKKP